MKQEKHEHISGSNLSRLDITVIVILAVSQGLLFWLITEAAESKMWVFDTLFATLTGYALVFSGPTSFQLIVAFSKTIRVAKAAIVVGVLIGSLAAYISWSATADQLMFASDTAFSSGLSLFIVWFVLLPFLQCKLELDEYLTNYPRLYYFAWRNTITLVLTAIFIGICWMLLFFWGELFEVINVEYFSTLFKKEWFVYCASGLFFGLGIVIGRTQDKAVEVAHFILLSLLKWLLPALCLILMGFLVSLPITGFDTLFETDVWSPVGVLISGLVLLVSFVNGVYRDGRQNEAYTKIVDKFISLTLIATPIFAIISIYGLWVRIEAYGWTVDRYWAVVITILLCMYIFGYAASQVITRGNVLRGLGQVNVIVALSIIGVGVVSNTPVMNPMSISANSQWNRLLSASITDDKFDYKYLRRSLGKPGDKVLKELQGRVGDGFETQRSKATLALSETSWRSRNSMSNDQRREALSQVEWYPENSMKDLSLISKIVDDRHDHWSIRNCFVQPERCRLISINLNTDDEKEHILLNGSDDCLGFSLIYSKKKNEWVSVGRVHSENNCFNFTGSLWRNNIRAEASIWKDLWIGSNKYSIGPE